MEIMSGVISGVESPKDKILGFAQESSCQHPGSTLSPAALHCTALCAKEPSPQLKINPFYIHSYVYTQIKLTKCLASKYKYISYLG